MTTYRIDLAYDGTGFHGYAAQPRVRTVQGELEEAVFRLTGPVETTVAGRTDRGVHASGQVVSFEYEEGLDCDRLRRSLNRQLGPEISVHRIVPAPDGFNARFSATRRAYTYLVLNRTAPDPFLARISWHYETPVDVGRMNAAAACLPGEHDFAAFCRRAPGRSTVRRLDSATWSDRGAGLLAFDIVASSFCHQMVRSIVALLVEVGRGRVDPGEVEAILEGADRSRAKGAAPPHGLTLVAVAYE